MSEPDFEDLELPLDAIVIRGGEMKLSDLAKSFQNHYDRCVQEGKRPAYWLSVNCIPGLDAKELAHQAKYPHPKLRASTIAAVTAAGFTIKATRGRQDTDGHCDLFKSSDDEMCPSEGDLRRLEAAFEAPIRNPFHKAY